MPRTKKKDPEVAPKEKEEAAFEIKVRLGKEEIVSSGATLLEAIRGLHKPVKITTKTFVVVTSGDRHFKTMLMPVRAKRLFYPVAQPYFAAQFEFLLK